MNGRANFNDGGQGYIDFSRFTFAEPTRGRRGLPDYVNAYIAFNVNTKGGGTVPVIMIRSQIAEELTRWYPVTEAGGVSRVRIGFDPRACEFAILAVEPGKSEGVKLSRERGSKQRMARIACPAAIADAVKQAFKQKRTELSVREFDGGIMLGRLGVLE